MRPTIGMLRGTKRHVCQLLARSARMLAIFQHRCFFSMSPVGKTTVVEKHVQWRLQNASNIALSRLEMRGANKCSGCSFVAVSCFLIVLNARFCRCTQRLPVIFVTPNYVFFSKKQSALNQISDFGNTSWQTKLLLRIPMRIYNLSYL